MTDSKSSSKSKSKSSNESNRQRTGSLLAEPYPSESEWKTLVKQFRADAIAHKLLLSHVPFVFRDEPLKYALFRRSIADEFGVEPTNVFIVGSGMAGRSLKGDEIEKEYSSDSDLDTLIVSESLFTSFVMQSLEWVQNVTMPDYSGEKPKSPEINSETSKHIGWLASNASKGIWRPDSLPNEARVRQEFFDRFSRVSLKVLGLQLSEDTVSDVNGRIARSFEDAVNDLSYSLYRLRKEFENDEKKQEK